MWIKLQISPRIYLEGVVSVLDGNFYWRCSNVHQKLLGGSYPGEGGVKARSLGAIQPEVLHVKPRIKVYSTWEMIYVLYCNPRGGPNLANFVWAILEHGKVRNNIALSFAFTFEQAPVFVVRLERDFENCHLLDLKNALRHFVGFVCREYLVMQHRFRHPTLPPPPPPPPPPPFYSLPESPVHSTVVTGSIEAAETPTLQPECMEEDVPSSARAPTLDIPPAVVVIPPPPDVPAAHCYGEGSSVVPDNGDTASSGIGEGTLFDGKNTTLNGLKDLIPWDDLSPELTMEILCSIVYPPDSSCPVQSSVSSSPPAVSVSPTHPTSTTNNNNNNNNNNSNNNTGEPKKKITCSTFLRVELGEDEMSPFVPNAILLKTKKGERIYLPQKQ